MTYAKEEARIEIQKLVEDFRAHEATLEKAAEAQIENNFIRPLFRYLNWNTENAGLSHAHYEFKVQATNKKGLRPDYILNLDGRDVLVMDAKQVKYSMKDPRWLYQVYSYAYSTQNSKPSEKIDFAILTDFQEFIVLDCTLFAAKPEAVNNFRVIDWTYNDYVDKFDELWELFERNHVLNDSHVIARSVATKQSPADEEVASGKERPRNDRGLWSRYLSPQKVKANRISPDKAFLAQMDDEKKGWRVLLAKDMKKRNPSADGELITAAVQLLIDRLIFIKALSDREVDKDYLGALAEIVEKSGLSDDDTSWFKACKNIFDELNNFYNGSIFQERRELENITVSNKVVRSVITDLQPENSPYNFAVLPVEILGTIYERFLGRVVHTTDKRVTIEEKPEVRKAGGVYYTPQYIVDYIVENTVGKMLDPTPNPSPNEERIRKGELTPADVAKIKILDPACGSGSFLLGAYSKLIQWHKDYFAARVGRDGIPPHKYREQCYKDESGQIRLTAKLKREILRNNLFGVDIDPQAVEVTRFSLSLKALEDLREGELTEERSLFHQTVLPDLSQNIKNGNSLVGNDYSLIAMERIEAKAFDWKSEFEWIMENGGFDCIIGNPPYLRIQGLQENYGNQIEYFTKQYKSAVKRFDFYLLFAERGFKLLKNGGELGFICPHKFLNSDFGSGLRDFLVENQALNKFISFGNNLVFEQASTYTGLLFLRKSFSKTFGYFEFENVPSKEIPESLGKLSDDEYTNYEIKDFSAEPWVLTKKNAPSLLQTLSRQPKTLGDVCDEILVGVQSGIDNIHLMRFEKKGAGNSIFLFSERANEVVEIESGLVKPIMRGEDVKRYEEPQNTYFCIYPYKLIDGKTKIIEESELKEKFPKGYAYLKKYQKELTEIRERQKTNLKYWYSCHRSRDMNVFESQRIITPEISLGCNMTIAPKGLYNNTKVYSIVPSKKHNENQLYWLGLLNSKLLWWYLSTTGYVLRGGYFVFKTNYLSPFPIRAIDFANPAEKSQHEKMVTLVSQMLALHKSKAAAKTQSEIDVYERQIKAVDESIDQLVYALYGLSEEEIKIVES
jgi:type I restriction-modification system DNA methylase subunit/NOL1/NOP2/fmu family ribosome biogenesis protein